MKDWDVESDLCLLLALIAKRSFLFSGFVVLGVDINTC
jgi:hypothetical protein